MDILGLIRVAVMMPVIGGPPEYAFLQGRAAEYEAAARELWLRLLEAYGV